MLTSSSLGEFNLVGCVWNTHQLSQVTVLLSCEALSLTQHALLSFFVDQLVFISPFCCQESLSVLHPAVSFQTLLPTYQWSQKHMYLRW